MWWHPPTPMAQASILDCFGPFRGLLGRQHRKLCATAGFPMARLLFRMQRKPEQEPTGLFGHEQEQTDTMDPKGQVGPTGADAGFRFGQTCFDKKKDASNSARAGADAGSMSCRRGYPCTPRARQSSTITDASYTGHCNQKGSFTYTSSVLRNSPVD